MTTTTPSADEFLLGGSSGKSAFGKNDPIGTTITGTIVSTEVRQQTDIATGELLTWDNGDPRMQLVVALQTDERISEDDEGVRAVYVKGSKAFGSKSLHDAVRAAVQDAGAKGIEPGGALTVSLIGTEPSKTRGFSDRKLWGAQYAAPDRAAQTGGFLGTTAPAPTTPAPVEDPVAAAPAPVAAPAPAAPTGEDAAAKARQLIALGIDDATIAGATGLGTDVVAILRTAA
ncbi:hypothetical protein ACFWGN_20790 [Oerskovia sp. NPDC060338]|uniref:hypothetical protein n=1 Tax=Oerskovia sp. NPDC060338 TaxID=3347100 RepID=UPI003663D0FB